MKLTFPFFLFSFFICSVSVYAQTFDVPKDFDAKNVKDFRKYNKDVVNCVNWLENTPVDQDKLKRKDAATFLIEWISGSPDVSITISDKTVTFVESPDLLLCYMGGWTKYVIESGNYADSVKGNLAGIKSVIKVYKANKSMKRDKEVDKLVALDARGELEKYEADQQKR